MAKSVKRWRVVLAHVAALLFVVQGILVQAAAAVPHETPPLDMFGNPLCITSDRGDGEPAGSHSHHSGACCLAGCFAFASAFPDEGACVTIDFDGSSVALDDGAADSIVPPSRYDPGNPRAPPLTV